MQVKATKPGYYEDKLIQVGETFDVPRDLKISWAKPVQPEKPEKKVGPKKP